MSQDVRKLIGDPLDALPPPIKHLVQRILDGEVAQLAMAVEYKDGGISTHVDKLQEATSVFSLIGAITVLQDDLLDSVRRACVPPPEES